MLRGSVNECESTLKMKSNLSAKYYFKLIFMYAAFSYFKMCLGKLRAPFIRDVSRAIGENRIC